MYFGATNFLHLNDATATFVNLQTAAQSNHPGCVPVIYSVTLHFINGATAGPNGILISDDAGTTIATLKTDFEVDQEDTIHMTWPNGLPLYRVSSSSAGGSGGLGTNAYEDKARDGLNTPAFRIYPEVTDSGDVVMSGVITYGFVPRSMIK